MSLVIKVFATSYEKRREVTKKIKNKLLGLNIFRTISPNSKSTD